MAWLNGKKTYLGMLGLGALGICWSQGWIDDRMAYTIGSVVSAWTGVSFAHKVSKLQK